jgi:hypothetical protein
MKMKNRRKRLDQRQEAYKNTLSRQKGTRVNDASFHKPGSYNK